MRRPWSSRWCQHDALQHGERRGPRGGPGGARGGALERDGDAQASRRLAPLLRIIGATYATQATDAIKAFMACSVLSRSPGRT
jgi:hypothetical protein